MSAFEPAADEPRLESWKAIAAYLNRDVRTAKRWEVHEGLPVHRHQHESRSSVYAYPREIDLWREGRKPAVARDTAETPAPKRPWLMLAAALVASLLSAGGGAVSLQGRAQAPVNAPTLHCEQCADFYGSVSRDGRMMAVVTPLSNVDIGIHDIVTGQVTPLRIGGSEAGTSAAVAPVFSPDGRQIAYTSGPLPVELRVVENEVGARPRTVVNNPEFDYLEPVGWSDANTIVVFLRRPDRTWEVGTVSSAGGAVTRIKSLGWRTPNAIHSANVSPDGRLVAYAALASNPSTPPTPQQGNELERQIYLLPLDESAGETAITTGSGVKNNPVWTPDGQHVLFTSDVSGAQDLWAMEVDQGKPSGQPKLIRKDTGGIASLGMSSSGRFYYYEGRAGVFRTEFANLGGNSGTAPPSFVGHRPTWSPDGSRMAVSRDRADGNGLDIVVRDLSTGEEQVYEVPNLQPVPFDWFPDGRRLLAAVAGPESLIGLQILDLESRAVEPVPGYDNASERRAPNVRALSPDGRTVYQGRFRPRSDPNVPAVQDRIVAVDIATGRSRDVMTLPFAEASLPRGAQHFALAVSPEGNQLAMMTYDRESELTRVAVVGTDGRDYHEVVPPLKAVNIRNKLAWTPDGRWLIAVSGGQDDEIYKIIRVPVAGGAVEESGLEIERLNAMSISPDGSRLAYSTLKPEGWGEMLWSLDVAAILRSDR